MCDILSRPGVPIITPRSDREGWVDLMKSVIERETKSALALIDNCDKNEADEK